MTTANILSQLGSPGVSTGTALLVLEHQKTGLKYFCKTTRLHEINAYKGSGMYWERHMKVHGREITRGVVGVYYDRKRLVEAALKFSADNDIVKSDAWANCIPENGLDGAGAGELHWCHGKEHPSKGTKRPHVGKIGADNPMFGKPSAMRGKKNLGASLAHKGRKRPEGGGKKPHAVIGTKDGVTVEFDSVADAARFINGNRSSIHRCCNGKAKTGGGYTWKYKEQA